MRAHNVLHDHPFRGDFARHRLPREPEDGRGYQEQDEADAEEDGAHDLDDIDAVAGRGRNRGIAGRPFFSVVFVEVVILIDVVAVSHGFAVFSRLRFLLVGQFLPALVLLDLLAQALLAIGIVGHEPILPDVTGRRAGMGVCFFAWTLRSS